MANLVSDGHLVVPEVLDQEAGLLLGDRVFLGNHPVLQAGYAGNLGASGSAKTSRDFGSHGLDALTSVAEATSIGGATDLDFVRVSVTVARQALQRRISELLRIIESTGAVSEERLIAIDAVGAYARRMTELIATIGSTFTGSVDAAGPLEWDTLIDAQAIIEDNGGDIDTGAVMVVLRTEQWTQLRKQLTRSELSDAMTHAPEAYQAILGRRMGYKGRYYGMDIFTTRAVPLAADETSYLASMLSPQSIAWADALIPAKGVPREYVLQGGKLQVRFRDDPDAFVDDAFYNAIFGMSKGLDGAGCVIKSAA